MHIFAGTDSVIAHSTSVTIVASVHFDKLRDETLTCYDDY